MGEFATEILRALSPADAAADWLEPVRERGRAEWLRRGLPDPRAESWRKTPLHPLRDGDYLAAPQLSGVDATMAPAWQIDEFDDHRLVFVNGRFEPGLSRIGEQAGLVLTPFSRADNAARRLILQRLGLLAEARSEEFVALGESALADGVLLHVEAGVELEKPVRIVHFTAGASRFSVNTRLLAVLGNRARATLVEHFCGAADLAGAFGNGVTEIEVGEGAALQHQRLHLEPASQLHIGTVRVKLMRNASLRAFQLATGSVLKRLDLTIEHAGEGAECDLDGVYLPRERELVDFHVAVRHLVANCTTRENYRGIVADAARAVFNGLIYIAPDAQKTDARLSNRNLLLGSDAEVDTKPELQIYANDVQCAHGATVAEIDPAMLHYLRSRGIDMERARALLSFGFVNELIDRIDSEPMRLYLRNQLATWLDRVNGVAS